MSIERSLPFPTGTNGFRIVEEGGQFRELDPEKPSDVAQTRFDELVTAVHLFGAKSASINHVRNPGSASIPKTEVKPQGPINSKSGRGEKMKPNRVRQTVNLRGLTGVWRNNLYVDGKRVKDKQKN